MTTEVPAQPAPGAAPVPAAQPDPNVTATPEPEAKPERTFTQAELDAAIEKRLAKERRKRYEVETRAKVFQELASKGKPEEPKPDQPQATGEPKREQFESYEAFLEAKAEWKADQAVEKRLAEREKASKEKETKAEQDKRAETFRTRMKEASKGLDDFDEVMAEATAEADMPVARLYAPPFEECDNPAAVLYHLAKNPEEAERIASLPDARQAREIWALDTKLAAEAKTADPKQEKKPSKAPEPIKPITGKSAADNTPSVAGNDVSAWAQHRNKQLASKRG